MVDISLLFDLGLIIIVATLLTYVAKLFKQPMLVAFVIAGVLIGPMGFGLITNEAEIRTLAELGVAFLLFTVGLEIDFKKLRNVGRALMVGGLLQVAITFFAGFLLAGGLGFDPLLSVYIGLLLAFSSTMIVTKFLVDKNEINTLHGRIMIGILLLQDVVVILALPLLSNAGTISFELMGSILVKGLGLFIVAAGLNRLVFPRLLDYAAKDSEILFLTAISTCFMFIGLSYFLGFSIAIGAFMAGLALANFPYTLEVVGETHSLRDFFSILFFTTLGMQLNLSVITGMLPEFLLILLMLVVVKPLILGLIYVFQGYGGRTSSIVGFGLGQASEFSFIIAAQGLMIGHLTNGMYSLIITTVVISMLITPYLMMFRYNIYSFLTRFDLIRMKRFTYPKHMYRLERQPSEKALKGHNVLFGCDRMGSRVAKYLAEKGQKFVVVEHNPERVKELNDEGIYCVYGSGDNSDIFKRVNLYNAKLVIITIPDRHVSGFIIEKTRRFNHDATIFARASSEAEAKNLYSAGANMVIVPDSLGGERIVEEIRAFMS